MRVRARLAASVWWDSEGKSHRNSKVWDSAPRTSSSSDELPHRIMPFLGLVLLVMGVKTKLHSINRLQCFSYDKARLEINSSFFHRVKSKLGRGRLLSGKTIQSGKGEKGQAFLLNKTCSVVWVEHRMTVSKLKSYLMKWSEINEISKTIMRSLRARLDIYSDMRIFGRS